MNRQQIILIASTQAVYCALIHLGQSSTVHFAVLLSQ